MDNELYDFAMVISVSRDCESEWERALRGAKTPAGMTMHVRTPALAMFTVFAEQEFLAIEMAQQFLLGIAKHAGVHCALNAQPAGEV
ncbi:MAG: hypothetical protein H7Y38_01775 [Armatimonadetes bacterium]|nr:hypothetical protein [Armatimonadota bacterium]